MRFLATLMRRAGWSPTRRLALFGGQGAAEFVFQASDSNLLGLLKAWLACAVVLCQLTRLSLVHPLCVEILLNIYPLAIAVECHPPPS